MSGWIEPLRATAGKFAHDLGVLALCALFFATLAVLMKGRKAISDARAAGGEIRINLILSVLGQLAVAPLITLFVLGLIEVLKTHGLHLAPPRLWDMIGQWPTLFLAILAFEIGITVWDFIEEDLSRRLPAGERAMHTIMAIVYGAFLAHLLPEIWQWIAQPTEWVRVERGLLSWILTAFAAGVFSSGIRDVAASFRMEKA